MIPHLVLRRILGCFLIGLALGPGVDLLRPLRPRLPNLPQAAICLWLKLGWRFAMFGNCRGALRMGYVLALWTGLGLWERLFGGTVTALCSLFWHFAILPLKIFRKIFRKFGNFLFARRQK